MYSYKKENNTIHLLVSANKVITNHISIDQEYAELYIHVAHNTHVTIVDTTVSAAQTVFVNVEAGAVVVYSMKTFIDQSVQSAKDVSVMLATSAQCAISSTVTCFGSYNFSCASTALRSRAQFFVGTTALIEGNGRYVQTITQLHEHESAWSESRIYAVVKDNGFFASTGIISVEQAGKGTIATHKAHGLTIGQGARAFAEPILRIIPYQVSCVHGAALGPLESVLLLYCASRGISEEKAKIILQEAFLAQINDFYPLWAIKSRSKQ